MPDSSSSKPTAAQPTRRFFDPWNSSSTGHQRAENVLSGSTSWRESRNLKLKSQFTSGATGGKRLYDTVGAGSENFGKDGRKENGSWEKGASGLRPRSQSSILDSMSGIKKHVHEVNGKATDSDLARIPRKSEELSTPDPTLPPSQDVIVREEVANNRDATPSILQHPQIFRSLTFYINGSTAPYISDHKLKRLLCEHGGNLSIALGRRSVTHVVLGTPSYRMNGAGGGLAGTKIQKEIARVGGKGVKYVNTEWIVESVKAGKRLPEARFAADTVKITPKGQKSVYGLFSKT